MVRGQTIRSSRQTTALSGAWITQAPVGQITTPMPPAIVMPAARRARPMAPASSQHYVPGALLRTSVYFGNRLVVMPGSNPMADNQTITATDRDYVHVVTLTKSISAFVLVACALSLILGYLSGFNALHPTVALLVGVASAVFLAMGFLMSKDRGVDAR